MTTEHSCIADATSDVCDRVTKAIQDARSGAGHDRLREVQKKVDDLSRRGLLKRQEYAAATTADFKKLFINKSQR